jgi:hypothetical protein
VQEDGVGGAAGRLAGAPGAVARTLNWGGSPIDTQAFVRDDVFMQLHGAPNTRSPEQPADQHAALPRIRGWLLVYNVALAISLLHGAVLTAGSVVIYADRAATGVSSPVPLGFLVYYDVTNAALIVYGIVLFIMMARRRRLAIVNNIIFNVLAVAFLVTWHLFGEKSSIGTIIDSVPNLAGALYYMLSRKARSTFIIRRPAGSAEQRDGAGRKRAHPVSPGPG